jgi:hypothetical protein
MLDEEEDQEWDPDTGTKNAQIMLKEEKLR